MTENRLYVHVLLDRSGSMETCRDTTIAAFNTYVRSLQIHDATLTRLSLTQFDTEGIDLHHDSQSVHIIGALTRETYVPRGGTPLYDAIAKTVAHIDGVRLAGNEVASLVILTDGRENASREHTKESIKALLESRQHEKNWLVLYLGANQDAFAEAAKIGVDSDYALEYSPTRVLYALSAASESSHKFSHGRTRAAAVITTAQRRAAKDQDQKA